KFVKNMPMATCDGGLSLVAYGPCSVHAQVGGGTRLEMIEETDYPFDGEVRLTLKLEKTARFPLVLHIPQWAEGATVQVNGAPQEAPRGGAFYALAREWADGDQVRIEMPMRVRLLGGHEGLVSVYR